MEVIIDLAQLIDSDEITMLKDLFKCGSEKDLEERMTGIIIAALNEYLEMILGKQLPTRANEIRERRLYHLLKHFFVGKLPTESEISSLFQITETRSKTLLRNVRTKFRFDLENKIKSTIRGILRKVEYRNDEFRVIILNENILEEMRHTISLEAPHLSQITKLPNRKVFKIPVDTLKVLCDYYQLNFEEIEAAATKE